MRVCLVGTFDLGYSYGLGDGVFQFGATAPETDIGEVGIRNPLGRGVRVPLIENAPDIVHLWREAAVRQVRRPEMETGWTAKLPVPQKDYLENLECVIRDHKIRRCELTIYAVGVVYCYLEIGPGVSLDYLVGVISCFEFAVYTSDVADALFTVANEVCTASVGKNYGSLPGLTHRKPAERIADASGYVESNLFRAMTNVLLCVDPGDHAYIPRLTEDFGINESDVIEYEYHGRIRYSWPVCIVEPRTRPLRTADGRPEKEIARILYGIQIAHSSQAACEAFLSLFLDEIHAQVNDYANGGRGGRSASELNQLRTIALAVANLTNLDLVTQCKEDNQYFRIFARDAFIPETQKMLLDACETLYSAQEAKAQHELLVRQTVLNSVVLALTTFTLISTTVVAYDFVRDQRQLILKQGQRVEFLLELLMALSILVLILFLTLSHRLHSRGRR